MVIVKWVLIIVILLILFMGGCRSCRTKKLGGRGQAISLANDFCMISDTGCNVVFANNKAFCPRENCPLPARCRLFEANKDGVSTEESSWTIAGSGVDSVDTDKDKKYQCACVFPKPSAIATGADWLGADTRKYCEYVVVKRFNGGSLWYSFSEGDHICYGCPDDGKCPKFILIKFRNDFYYDSLVKPNCAICTNGYRLSEE
ncbi:MAG TPA: hypothetical protein VFV08_00500 [Puia sp.]|nr:hypothetical protein [Puia sp.]